MMKSFPKWRIEVVKFECWEQLIFINGVGSSDQTKWIVYIKSDIDLATKQIIIQSCEGQLIVSLEYFGTKCTDCDTVYYQ